MRIPSWAVPLVLRLLSLTSLASAGGGNAAGDLRVAVGLGFALSGAESPTKCGDFPTATTTAPTLSQPSIDGLSLDLDVFVRVGEYELKTAIMPLHLLGKKSWNVYNTDNIERVKRDEAAAAAREAAEEERMQELDSERRMQILRGEIPTPLPIADCPSDRNDQVSRREDRGDGRERKRRKKTGENDTDFEMRVAREEASKQLSKSSQLVLRKESSAPLTDHKGHISLFLELQPKRLEKNAEAEAEAAKKKREYEDQYTMRFSNAAGFKQDIGSKPWYSKADTIALADRDAEVENEDNPGKDVWGNEDPRRKERETQRLLSSDPLAMMKAGAAQVRQIKKEREKWREEKERELAILEKEGIRKRKRTHDEDDDLDSFKLDESERVESRRHEDMDKDRGRERDRDHKRGEKESKRRSHREDGHRDRHRSSHNRSHRRRHHDR